jgi:DNA-binding NtrC family response regulator
VEKEFSILIADRNRHVREFLKREMTAEGYIVRLAKTGREVLKLAYLPEPLDLIILDLDLPDMEELPVFEKLENRIPTVPVVVHAFRSDYSNASAIPSTATFVEKEGGSIEHLKKVIRNLLPNHSP